MTFYTSTLLNENISNFSQIEDNAEDLSSWIHLNSIFKYGTDLSNLDEVKDENENLFFIHNENIERFNNSKLIFKTERTKKKRGPKKRKESKKAEHNDWSIDNITSKIQIHYLNFIVSFLNDCVFSYFGKKKFSFVNINHKEKSKVSRKHLEKLKNSKILDILKNIDISNKYKHYNKDINKMNVEALIKYSWFRKIFETKYLELFLHYYNNKEPLKDLILFEKKVILSEKTKSFYYLLQKKEELKEQIIYFCKLIYLVDINGIYNI